MKLIKFDEMKKTWHQIARYNNGDVATNFELEVYKKMLDIFQVGQHYFYIVNIAKVEMKYVNENVAKVLGISPEDLTVEYIFENIHPADKTRFAVYEQKVTEFFNQLPPEKVLKYKVSYDYRLRCKDGSYKWILMQTLTIQSDENGSVIRVLGVQTDISHLKTENKGSGLSFLGLDGEPSFYNVAVGQTVFLRSEELLSKREKEVLRLVLSGKSSAQIAEILNISIHTVKTHRKKIWLKSNCRSLAELGAKAVKEAWL